MKNMFFKKLLRGMVFEEGGDKNSKSVLKAELDLKNKLLNKSLRAAEMYRQIVDKHQKEGNKFKDSMQTILSQVEGCLCFGKVVLTEKFSNKSGPDLIFTPNQMHTTGSFAEIRYSNNYCRLKKSEAY